MSRMFALVLAPWLVACSMDAPASAPTASTSVVARSSSAQDADIAALQVNLAAANDRIAKLEAQVSKLLTITDSTRVDLESLKGQLASTQKDVVSVNQVVTKQADADAALCEATSEMWIATAWSLNSLAEVGADTKPGSAASSAADALLKASGDGGCVGVLIEQKPTPKVGF